ncbi:hypothetical protein D6Y79_12305 [Escherichia coli]|nr:hypothetical protein B1200_05830 [Escherichia coli]OUD19738.1 hypothetical protein BUN10_26105 [Vibrio parahaemolyticus]EEW6411569.1 hypothetical protein [Escherichia coli]EEW7628831.1 hypothetical protein [Escherichia coli]EFN8909134.1 hypothetical protein [Escherichia coli]
MVKEDQASCHLDISDFLRGKKPANGWLLYSSYFKLHVLRLRSFTPVTYFSKLLGIHSLVAFLQLELFRV